MCSIYLFLTIFLMTVANCEKTGVASPNIEGSLLPKAIVGKDEFCNCKCSVLEYDKIDHKGEVKKGVVNNKGLKLIVTACPQSGYDELACYAFCVTDCLLMTSGTLGINYGYKVNLVKGVTCVHDNTTENYDYGNCTHYKNTIQSGPLTDGCKDYCEGTVGFPKTDVTCTHKMKSSNGTVSEGTKRCNCKCTKQEDKNNPLVITACPQNFDKAECEKFCTDACPKAIKNKDNCQDIYGFKLNDRNGVTCVHDGKTKKKYQYDNCTSYKNAIPGQSLTDACENYCAGTAQFLKSDVVCTTREEVPTKHDEL